MDRQRALASFPAALAVIVAAGCADRPTDPVLERSRGITQGTVRARIAALSDDSLRGRATASAGLDRAAAYAAASFRDDGLAPVLPTGFVQTWNAPAGPTPNVVGVLEGSDPALASEYVLFVAHLDHIGTTADGIGCRPVGADSICNGADDNASGAAGVLELARAFGGLRPPPRRSMIFLLVSGEEEGLLGSAYYVAHPAKPIAQTVAALNLDMIGRNWPDTVLVVDMDLSSLGETAASAAWAHAELGMHPAPASFPGGSDQVSFETAGVPSLFFFTGLHADYHRASDAVAAINAEKTARLIQLVYWIGYEVARAPERPVWYAGAQPAPAGGPAARR